MSRSDASPPAGSEPVAVPAGPAPAEVRVSGTLRLDEIFTPPEAALVVRLQAFAAEGGAGRYAQDLERALAGGLRSLATMALALGSYPSLRDRHVLGVKERSFETLLRTLVEGGEHGLEWVLPTKAVLARTYGIAKVHFFTSLRYVVEAVEGPEASRLHERLTEAIEETVYTRLAEELYASFITSRVTSRDVKEVAAQHLVDLWEGRTGLATKAFCPLLRSAWAARTRAPRIFGTLMGTSEIVQLLFQDCDEEFIGWFTRHEHESEQRQAFEEFLFDLSFENLERVRHRMKEEDVSVVGPAEVERWLGFGPGRLRPLVGDPKGLYVSFRRRRVKAQYRASVGVPGPKRTAEGYILETLLRAELQRDPAGGPTPPPA